METILVIDEDGGFRSLLSAILTREGYQVISGSDVADARKQGAARQFDLVLTDLRLPDGEGLDVLRWFHQHAPDTPVIVITALGSASTPVEAMKLGAADYLGKPLASPDELRLIVRKAIRQRQAGRELELFKEEERERFSCDRLIAHDPRMISALQVARKVAATNSSVLITGESGSGKEGLARCIHENSSRKDRLFVAVNCIALPPALIESELFGQERDDPGGAVAHRIGRFERANGGTLFLDEIADLDGTLQTKLLRVLQEKTFERVGGTRQITADVRVLAATNRDLNNAVAQGKFRADLHHRLNAFSIYIPPLRERPADIPHLAQLFITRAAKTLGKPPLSFSEDAMNLLLGYTWPGNVRELANLMERLAILCDREIRASDLPFGERAAKLPMTWSAIERQAIEDALRAHHGNRTQAARQLGISLRTLQYRLKEYAEQDRKPPMADSQGA
jgi:two-component system response regulator HydG/two-component system response regulator AtoC